MTVRSLSAAGIIPKPRCRRKRGIISGALPRACRGGQDILLTRCNCFRFYLPLHRLSFGSRKSKNKLSRFFLLKNRDRDSDREREEEEEDNIHDSSQFRHRRPLRFGPSDSTIESEYEGTKVVAPVVLSFKWRLYKFFN